MKQSIEALYLDEEIYQKYPSRIYLSKEENDLSIDFPIYRAKVTQTVVILKPDPSWLNVALQYVGIPIDPIKLIERDLALLSDRTLPSLAIKVLRYMEQVFDQKQLTSFIANYDCGDTKDFVFDSNIFEVEKEFFEQSFSESLKNTSNFPIK